MTVYKAIKPEAEKAAAVAVDAGPGQEAADATDDREQRQDRRSVGAARAGRR